MLAINTAVEQMPSIKIHRKAPCSAVRSADEQVLNTESWKNA